MKWTTIWDEIEITAETEEDINLLKQLSKKLSREALYSYDIGELEVVDNVVNGKNNFSIIFIR